MPEAEKETQSKGGCFHLDGRSLDEVSAAEISLVRDPRETNCRMCEQQLACFRISMPEARKPATQESIEDLRARFIRPNMHPLEKGIITRYLATGR